MTRKNSRKNARNASRKSQRGGNPMLQWGGALPKHSATMHGINHWHKHMFEKLGWMVLAKAKGYKEKIVQYKHGLKHLLETIDHVSAEYKDHNRKHDLNVLRMNVVELHDFVMKHL